MGLCTNNNLTYKVYENLHSPYCSIIKYDQPVPYLITSHERISLKYKTRGNSKKRTYTWNFVIAVGYGIISLMLITLFSLKPTSNWLWEKTTLHVQHNHIYTAESRIKLCRNRNCEIPIKISMFKNTHSLFMSPKSPKIFPKNRHYGGIRMSFLPDGTYRKILPHTNPDALLGHIYHKGDFGRENRDDDSVSSYYAFDDDYVRGKPFRLNKEMECRRTSWHRLYHPSCNVFHEIVIDSRKIGYGAYRDVFKIKKNNTEVTLKVQRYHDNPFTIDRYEFIRMDALVMERLTASPRITSIYGHCATSIISEFLPHEVQNFVIPGSGYITNDHLNDNEDVNPHNNLTPAQKLQMALKMTESIADLHGFTDGIIVHDDIQLAQFLYTKQFDMKLNDFNRAEVFLYDIEQGKYCRYKNGKGGGNYRSPEEYSDNVLNEKIDIWSMGNNIYALLTGLWIFYDDNDEKLMHSKVASGEIAFIDPRYKTRSYAEKKLVEIMEKCWKFDPDERPEIFEVVQYLRNAIRENDKLYNRKTL